MYYSLALNLSLHNAHEILGQILSGLPSLGMQCLLCTPVVGGIRRDELSRFGRHQPPSLCHLGDESTREDTFLSLNLYHAYLNCTGAPWANDHLFSPLLSYNEDDDVNYHVPCHRLTPPPFRLCPIFRCASISRTYSGRSVSR